MTEPDYVAIAVYNLTLTGKLPGYTVSLTVFVIAKNQEAALSIGRAFMLREYPSVQMKGIKASWAIEDLLVAKELISVGTTIRS